ncbi:MAG: aryldialkylphosphatase [Dehalococcoidia bacterium]
MAFVRTVLGDIAPEELGVTLPHEHLLIDLKPIFSEPKEATEIALAYKPVTIENLGWIRRNYAGNLANIGLYDEEMTIEEALRYKRAGGCSIVETTGIDQGRDPMGLARIARATGLNIVMGSAYNVDSFHPPGMDNKDEDELVEEMVGDVTVGAGGSGIRSGIIGEVGCSWPSTQNERKVLRAAARAQRHTGAALTIHPGRHPTAPLEILAIIQEAGGEIKRTIMGHLGRTIFDLKAFKELAGAGCYLEYDQFGLESSYYPFGKIDLPNDGRRVDIIKFLVSEGHLDQILVSHDIAYKTSLVRYGGYGYAHILENVVPLMRRKGLQEEQIQAILVGNPQQALTFV